MISNLVSSLESADGCLVVENVFTLRQGSSDKILVVAEMSNYLLFHYSNKNLSQCKSQSDDQLDRIGTCDKNEYWPSDTHRKDFKVTFE